MGLHVSALKGGLLRWSVQKTVTVLRGEMGRHSRLIWKDVTEIGFDG